MSRTVVDVNGFTKIGGVQSIQDNRFNITGSSDVTKRVRFEVDGFTAGTTRTITPPDADIEIQGTHEVISTNWTARNHGAYTLIASGTATDPGTPSPGHEYTTLVRNGTATIGGTSYATAGAVIRRVYHSGSWTNYQYPHVDGAWTWSATQRFDSLVGIGVTPTAGNGLLQFASGTTKANGIAFGTDTGFWRATAGLVIFDALGTANNPAISLRRSSGANLDMFATTGSGYVGTATNHPLVIRTNNTDRMHIDATGNVGIGVTPTSLGGATVQASTGMFAIGSTGSQQFYSLGVSQTQRWTWVRDTANNLLLYRDLTGVAGPAGTALMVDTSGNLGIGVTPTAGNGLLQLASGTTKANGIAFGTDTFLYRAASGGLKTDGYIWFPNATDTPGGANVKGVGTRVIYYDDSSSAFWHHLGAGLGLLNVAVSNGGLSACVWGWYAGGSYTATPAKVATIDGNGIFDITGGSRAIRMNGTQVVSNRKTGWTAPTGTATRTGFATSTATLTQVAEALKALIDDLHGTAGHGLIGT